MKVHTATDTPLSSGGPAVRSRAARYGVYALVLGGVFTYLVGVRRESLQQWDDAYITFRFAQHLADGQGLCWNVGGEPVEGFTSLLHVLLLAGGFRVGLSPETVTTALSATAVVSTVALIAYALVHVFGYLHPLVAVLLTLYLIDPTTAIHSTSGLETQLFVLLLCASYVAALLFVNKPRLATAGGVAVCLFLSVLCRPEGVLFGAATLGVMGMSVLGVIKPGVPSRSAWWACLALLLLLGVGYAAWKYRYFGYLFPNPFYVKSDKLIVTGLRDVLRFFKHVLLWLGPVCVCVLLFSPIRKVALGLRSRGMTAPLLLSLVPPLLALGYYTTIVHEVGGAYRFCYPTYFYILIASCIIVTTAVGRMGFRPRRWGTAVAVVAPCLMLLFVTGEDVASWKRLPRSAIVEYHHLIARTLKETGIGPHGTVITVAAGVIPYVSGFNHIDPIGLTDNYLSGRSELSAAQREEYLWKHKADVYLGFEPPASQASTGPADDVSFRSSYVTEHLLHRPPHPMESRFLLRDPQQLYARMRELRDNWICVGEVDWPGWRIWKLKSFVYVRKRSPFRTPLTSAFEKIVKTRPVKRERTVQE